MSFVSAAEQRTELVRLSVLHRVPGRDVASQHTAAKVLGEVDPNVAGAH
jgi:hypothetical protein